MSDDLINEFIANAGESGARVHCAPDSAALSKVLEEILSDGSVAFCPGTTSMEKSVIIPERNRTADYMRAAVVIEEVSAGVAESGTIVVRDFEDRPIQASMICEHYVAIVNRLTILPTLEDLFSTLVKMPANLTLITGPSRTADIEKNLVVGMHGPGKVSIVITSPR